MLNLKKLLTKMLATPKVVEQETSGTWIYRKWSDGVAECWGETAEETLSMTTAYGNGFYGPLKTVILPSGLFTATPSVQITPKNPNGTWIGINGLGATYFSYYPFNVKSGSQSVALLVHAIGRWK